MICSPRSLLTSLAFLFAGSGVLLASPALRYEFSQSGEIQASTGRDELDITIYQNNGVEPGDLIQEIPATAPGTGSHNVLDFRYAGSTAGKAVAMAILSQYAPLTTELDSFTFTTWVYGHTARSDGGVRRLVRLAHRNTPIVDFRLGKASVGSHGLLSLSLNNEAITVAAPKGSGVFVPTSEDRWHFVAVTYDANSGEVKFFSASEGGVLQSYSETLESPLKLQQNATTFVIGNAGRGHQRQVDACLSDIRFYDRALSDAEVQTIFTGETSSSVAWAGLLLLGVPFFNRRILAGALIFTLSALPMMAVELVRDHQPVAMVVIPDDAPAVVRHAARDLIGHVKEATGAELIQVAESNAPADLKQAIYLGETEAFKRTGHHSFKLKKNAFLRHATDDALYLAGRDDTEWKSPVDGRLSMGTLLAVYDLLDRDVGVRWLWPGEAGTEVPTLSSLSIKAAASEVVEPRFLFTRLRFNRMRHRISDWENGEVFAQRSHEMVNEWMRRHRVLRTLNIETNHGYGKYWERFGKTHPEIFALRPDGKRGPIDKRFYLAQMCVSNPELWQIVVDDWRKDDPLHPWIVGFENDRRAIDPVCVCDGCRAWDIPEAKISVFNNPWHIDSRAPDQIDPYESVSLSDRYARYYLELQKLGRKYDPFAKVVGYAYSNYSDPPVKSKLNPNIIISVVPPYIYPFDEGKEDQFRKLWDGWLATGASLYYRPNHTLVGYCMPYIYNDQFKKDIRYAIDNGMIGSIFDSLLGMWGVQGPDLYLLGRIHARPEMDADEILNEYYAAFGPAEKAVRDYFDYWEEITKKCNEAFREEINGGWAVISKGGHLIYTPAVMEKGKALLQEAVKVAKDSPKHAARVKYLSVWLENAKLSIELMRMCRIMESGEETKEQKMNRLAARDVLVKFRNENQNYFLAANWDRVGPYEPWNKWTE